MRSTTLGVGVGLMTLLTLALTPGSSTAANEGRHAAKPASCGSPLYDSDEPSELLPPPANAYKGWTRTYCSDFPGTQLPQGWDPFSGSPKGDPAGLWAPSHVTVKDGLLTLSTWRDPAYGNRWVSGGVCQCGLGRVYGAYFVRARLTAGGASNVALLWPKDNSWPPEIDFFEAWHKPNLNTFTVHYSAQDHIIQGWLRANLTKWHTWIVVWLPNQIVFRVDWNTVDWSTWGRITLKTAIPTIPMTLDLQQQVWTSIGGAYPSGPVSMQIDWVTEFVPTAILHAGGANARGAIRDLGLPPD